MAAAESKIIARRKKFLEVKLPILETNIEVIGENNKEAENKTIKLDLTRYLKGKSVEGEFRVHIRENKLVAEPFRIKLMSYFIRRMIRKRISYVEDSFSIPSQESMVIIKPFIITRKRVSRAVRKTLRNKAKNWIEDYIAERKDQEIFSDILSNKMQKPLSLMLKKTYPLSLCEIRVLEIVRPLQPNEIPKIKPKVKAEEKTVVEALDQYEEEKVKEAEEEIKKTQKKAAKKAKEITEENPQESESQEKKPKIKKKVEEETK
ncbi:hypothetical protein J4456_04180 [Candidatus Pacearchaeota archaeon]|nr:hypothetical protein [uncultured archaeon]AQS29426.1 hypothetical protein [uncultured archaeon]AQS34054.1 hypothetical protein [uncultured archaeon]MBS3093748.1 hypothetical protein [Candidatus Pacearchaeota archaeon]